MPGADHFFHRRLTTLKRLVIEHIAGAERSERLAGPEAVRDE